MNAVVTRYPVRSLILVGLVLALLGCESSSSVGYQESSQDEATVKGTVKVKGKPLPAGTVHFNASNTKRMVGPREAPIAKDGTFTLKAYVGQNIVSILPPRNLKGAEGKNRAYVGLEDFEKTVDIKPGEENVIDLDLTP